MKQLAKADVLAEIIGEHERLLQAMAGLPDAELLERAVRPTPEPGQSCKDVLGHLTAWEQRMLAQIRVTLVGSPQPTYPSAPKFNLRVFEANRDRSWSEVRAEFERSYNECLSFVTALTDNELATDGAWQLIAYNTNNHYRWASTAIKQWRKARGGTAKPAAG